ncbi:MAG: ABC transporter permease [Ktedonobacteraceae bacterium]|nr:ABC transporter permease [Ktedonobacteraceae bacterium]
MTFLALLTKELRLRMRRERTVWVIIVYILFMSLLGGFFISRYANSDNGYSSVALSQTGNILYILLSFVQLFLILFITPAFTSTSINGEKERQTFDLLLCSRLSSFALVSGKLVAGLANALLLIAAALPLFSLVFLFGGVSPTQVLSALLVYIVTTLMLGTFGLFCSTLVKRPAASTALVYIAGILWLIVPLVLYAIIASTGGLPPSSQWPPLLFIWNPATALYSTYAISGNQFYSFGDVNVAPWIAYTILNSVAIIVFFVLSMWTAKPNSLRKLHMERNQQRQKNAKFP